MHAHISTLIIQIYAQKCKKSHVALGIYLIKSTPRWQPLGSQPSDRPNAHKFSTLCICSAAAAGEVAVAVAQAAITYTQRIAGNMPHDNFVGVYKCA